MNSNRVRRSPFSSLTAVLAIGTCVGLALAAVAPTPAIAQSPSNASPASATAARSSRDIAEVVWRKAFEAGTANERRSLTEQIHGALNKAAYQGREEGLFYAALAYLHALDKETRFAAPAFLTKARSSWSELGDAKEAAAVWKALRGSFVDGTILDDTALVAGALALQGQALKDAEDTSFHYYLGLGLYQVRKYPEALAAFQRVAVTVEHYRRAKFLEALIHLEAGRVSESRDAFQIVVAMDRSDAEKISTLPARSVVKLRELGVLNLARLAYEQGEFLESLAYYRTLRQDSHSFHESLSEQGWSFFMAGYPNRALGAQYAAASPFFADRFNPDPHFLGAVLYYWMCDFEGARKGLARFVEHTRREGDELRKRVAEWAAVPESDALLRFAKLYDDARSGVSARNVGLGPSTLATLLSKDAPRDVHAASGFVTKERLRLTRDVASRQGADRILRAVGAFERDLKLALGRRVQAAMAAMSADFEKSLGQARLLYLEILTAKKDVLLGKERSVKGQEFVGVEKPFEDAFVAADTQKWAQDKNEYWFDELGHYVFQVRSQCGAPAGPDKQEGASGGG